MVRQFTFAELQGCPLPELQALYRQMQLAHAARDAGIDCRRHALANLDLLRKVIALKQRPQGLRF